MKAITLALLLPAALFICAGTGSAQLPGPAFSIPDATQHFVLNKDGGVISAEAANSEDPAVTNLIQERLAKVALAGLPELNPFADSVKYTYESTWNGAQIRIRTTDPAALRAVHNFLAQEIRELNTGDSDTVTN